MIKAIVFDYGQTLVDSSAGFRMAEKQARETLADLLPSGDDTFVHHYREVRSRFHAASNFSRVAMWQQALEPYDLTIEPGRLETMEHAYWQLVRDHTRLFPETLSVLRKLYRRYRLAIISNTQGERSADAEVAENGQASEQADSLQTIETHSRQPSEQADSGNPPTPNTAHTRTHRLFAHSDLSELFEHVIIAGENGIPAKPHPEPFILCLQKLGLCPEEMLYIGDDWHKDLLGAGGCGIRALWLQHSSVSRNWPVDAASHNATVITSLEPLLDEAFMQHVHHIPIHHPS